MDAGNVNHRHLANCNVFTISDTLWKHADVQIAVNEGVG